MNTIFKLNNENDNGNAKHFIFIDGSYYVFYRYFAILRWFSFAKKGEDISSPHLNEEFMDKFTKTFISTIKGIKKKLKLPDDTEIIVGKDCRRKNIWRNEFCENYKGTRVTDEGFSNGGFFKIAYDHEDGSGNMIDGLFKQAGIGHIITHPKLEADDCIALVVKKYILNTKNSCTIITGDHDYLQLNYPNVTLMTLKFKRLDTEKNSLGNPKKDLYMKIIIGDKSDNIPPLFKRCGKKTAQKYIEDKEKFVEKVNKENMQKRFKLNKKLIDFNQIPEDLATEFYNSI